MASTSTTAETTTETTTSAVGGANATLKPSFFCFVLMMPSGYELSLMRAQLRRSLGIFSCDGWRVYSNETLRLAATVGTVAAVRGPLARGLDPGTRTVRNRDVFVQVWARVISYPRAWEHDWLVKVDPDAVFFPGRLRELLRSLWPPTGERPGLAVYLNNCATGFHGPIEVLSRASFAAYNHGRGACQEGWPASSPQEDAYLGRCLDMLAVKHVDAFDVLGEAHCAGGPGQCESRKVAFHPFKTVDSWMHCWNSAVRLHWNHDVF